MTTAIKATVFASVLLILLGVGFYLGTGRASVTALIPAFFGLPLLLCALISRTPRSTKIAMHIAVLLALLGAAGSARVFGDPSKFTQPAGIAQLAMFALCLALIVIYIRSFIAARRAGANNG